MGQKLVYIILSLLCVVFLGITAFVYVTRDTKGPTISFGENVVTYKEGDDTVMLLEGVTATDDKDGDVTDSLIVESVIPFSGKAEAKVIYAAKDKSNNISKAERIVVYVLADGSAPVSAAVDPEGESGDNDLKESEPELGETAEEETSEAETDEPESIEETQGETTADEILNDDTSELVSTGAPLIRLTHKKVTLNQGESFDPIDYVAEMVDDVDERWYLATRLSVEVTGGTPWSSITHTPGTYEVKFFVVDKNLNSSNVEVLEVVVK